MSEFASESVECPEVQRCFVLKKKTEDPDGERLLHFIQEQLGCQTVTGVRTGTRYDVSGLDADAFEQAKRNILSEAPVEEVSATMMGGSQRILIESQPGQYNQTEDWAQQGILLEVGQESTVRAAKCIILEGEVPSHILAALKKNLINPNENREASSALPRTLDEPLFDPADVKVLDGFTTATDPDLINILGEYKLAMTLADLQQLRSVFAAREKRDPTVTELKIIDTYWSDHCRHTTFTTALQHFFIDDSLVAHGEESSDVTPILETSMQRCLQQALHLYLEDRQTVEGSAGRPASLMDLALLSMRRLQQSGRLEDMEKSAENNAASIIVTVHFEDGHTEEWLYMFKNETHNHPTEIEPYGGAATCIGGAIRDPLSGRVYVFMGMRVSGSGDPRTPLADTLNGKLSQYSITSGAANGFSGYGNQIGVPTQKVREVYHPGYRAKRLECGFVGGAAPLENVCREEPADGDVVILLGGRTGRDGINGATGSSGAQTEKSTEECGSEVQKGNAPEERKIQRLFRNPSVSRIIKRCNDFGAGGVSVAIGELSDGLAIDLDAVPLKYAGLNATEIAISESQERMAVVVSPENLAQFLAFAAEENLEATEVARVTAKDTLTMTWRGKVVCNIPRDVLNGGWAKRTADVRLQTPEDISSFFGRYPEGINPQSPLSAQWIQNLGRLNVSSNRGIQQQFDSTVGANTIKNPYGGMEQVSPSEAAVVKFPVPGATTAVASSIGFDPELSAESPFHGAVYAVVDAVARIVATGGDRTAVRLTLQNYFEKLGHDAARWGQPMLAQLGAYLAEKMLDVPAIGGKDSMSGTFVDKTTNTRIDVPPTLVAFAIATMEAQMVIHSEFQRAESTVLRLHAPRDENGLPDWEALRAMWDRFSDHARLGHILSAHAVHAGGTAAALTEMSIGNKIGMHIPGAIPSPDWFSPDYGSMVIEVPEGMNIDPIVDGLSYTIVGRTTNTEALCLGNEVLTQDELVEAYESPLDAVFPRAPLNVDKKEERSPRFPASTLRTGRSSDLKSVGKPTVSVLTLPGTNCEYETANAFRQAGSCNVQVPVFQNLTRTQIEQSIGRFAAMIDQSHIVALPGGFSAGDEPGGSGKFGAAVLRSARINDAMEGLYDRGGLVLGICNGFQILMKARLFSNGNGRASELYAGDPTLTHNDIGRFQSRNVQHVVSSVLSPWMHHLHLGEILDFPIAHGEGKLIQLPASFLQDEQVPFQYAGRDGLIRDSFPHNPNGSILNAAAATDKTGRIFGMMAHPERALSGLSVNVPTERRGLDIFKGGLQYFR